MKIIADIGPVRTPELVKKWAEEVLPPILLSLTGIVKLTFEEME